MTLVKWEPGRDLTLLHDRIGEMFQDTLWRSFPREEGALDDRHWTPEVDILEDQEHLVIKAELPEMDLKDIEVKVGERLLTIKGERKMEKEEKKENYYQRERKYGSFSRSFTLPETVEQEKITAAYDRGVLKIVLPKKEETKPRRISIDGQ